MPLLARCASGISGRSKGRGAQGARPIVSHRSGPNAPQTKLFLLNVLGHLAWKFSDYRLVLCVKLHIWTHHLPSAPTVSSRKVEMLASPQNLIVSLSTQNWLNNNHALRGSASPVLTATGLQTFVVGGPKFRIISLIRSKEPLPDTETVRDIWTKLGRKTLNVIICTHFYFQFSLTWRRPPFWFFFKWPKIVRSVPKSPKFYPF